MKVCIPITNFTFEGNVVFDLAKELAKSKLGVKLVVPHAKGLAGEEERNGVRIKRFRYFWPDSLESLAYGSGIVKNVQKNPLKSLLLPFFLLGFSVKVLREARECNVIHAQWLPSAFACLPAKVLLGKPVLLTIHGTDIRNVPLPFVWLGLKATDAVTTSHDGLVEKIEKAGKKPSIIRNMIDFGAFQGAGSVAYLKKEFKFWEKPVVLSIGRLIELRDPFTFIKAAKLVPEANFVFVGHGKLLEKAMRYAQEIQANNVFFTGRRSDVAAFLKRSSIFVSTATFDNVFSSAVVEAALAEKPLVLTNVGKTAEYFNQKNSVLFPVGNEKQLALAVKGLLRNPARAKEIARNAKQLMKEVGFERKLIVEQTEALYGKVAGH